MLNPTTLKTLIISDPYTLGTAALVSTAEGGTGNVSQDGTILPLLNAPLNAITVTVASVPFWYVLKWLGLNQRFNKITAAANSFPASADVQNIASVALKLFGTYNALDNFDTSDSGLQTMLATLVAAGVLASADVTAFNALGARPGSPIEATFAPGVVATLGDVSNALRGQG